MKILPVGFVVLAAAGVRLSRRETPVLAASSPSPGDNPHRVTIPRPHTIPTHSWPRHRSARVSAPGDSHVAEPEVPRIQTILEPPPCREVELRREDPRLHIPPKGVKWHRRPKFPRRTPVPCPGVHHLDPQARREVHPTTSSLNERRRTPASYAAISTDPEATTEEDTWKVKASFVDPTRSQDQVGTRSRTFGAVRVEPRVAHRSREATSTRVDANASLISTTTLQRRTSAKASTTYAAIRCLSGPRARCFSADPGENERPRSDPATRHILGKPLLLFQQGRPPESPELQPVPGMTLNYGELDWQA